MGGGLVPLQRAQQQLCCKLPGGKRWARAVSALGPHQHDGRGSWKHFQDTMGASKHQLWAAIAAGASFEEIPDRSLIGDEALLRPPDAVADGGGTQYQVLAS